MPNTMARGIQQLICCPKQCGKVRSMLGAYMARNYENFALFNTWLHQQGTLILLTFIDMYVLLIDLQFTNL